MDFEEAKKVHKLIKIKFPFLVAGGSFVLRACKDISRDPRDLDYVCLPKDAHKIPWEVMEMEVEEEYNGQGYSCYKYTEITPVGAVKVNIFRYARFFPYEKMGEFSDLGLCVIPSYIKEIKKKYFRGKDKQDLKDMEDFFYE
jgi:hypothetical protein